MKETILVLEDDKNSLRFIEHLLVKEGYTVEKAMTLQSARSALRNHVFDLAVFDINLPDGNSVSLLKEIRSNGNEMPVIFLTIRDMIEDKLHGLESGADDYITKPFNNKEFLARVKVVFKRTTTATLKGSADIICGSYILDLKVHQVAYNKIILQLKPREFTLFYFLALHENKIVSNEKLLKEIENKNSKPNAKNLTIAISRLRKSLKETFGTDPIQTILGEGYIFSSKEH